MVYNCPKCGLESKSDKRLKIDEEYTCENCNTTSKAVLMYNQDVLSEVTDTLKPINRIDELSQGFLAGRKTWVFKPLKSGGYILALLDNVDVEDWGDKAIPFEDVNNLLEGAKNKSYIEEILERISVING